MRTSLIVVSCLLFFTGCFWDYKNRNYNENYKVLGLVPIYNPDPLLKLVKTDTPRAVINAGKIYAYRNFLLQCEVGEGIHVIDNSQPSKAKRIAFIQAKGANEISIKDSYLYTNSYKDLLVIDISNLNDAKEVKRLPNAFNVNGYLPTPNKTGYYECVDVSKGIVVGWKQDSVSYNNCISYQQ